MPKHIALTISGVGNWAETKNITMENAYASAFQNVEDLVQFMMKLHIPITTFFVLSERSKQAQQFSFMLDAFVNFIKKESFLQLINSQKIKITVIGKWYDLPSNAVESIKKIIEETKDYDSFFLNFCVNYNGQEEIVDACRLIARQIKAQKLDPEMITKDTIKENIYSSYFIPPDIIIKNGFKKEKLAFLLWDSPNAVSYFKNKPFTLLSKKDILDIIKDYQADETNAAAQFLGFKKPGKSKAFLGTENANRFLVKEKAEAQIAQHL